MLGALARALGIRSGETIGAPVLRSASVPLTSNQRRPAPSEADRPEPVSSGAQRCGTVSAPVGAIPWLDARPPADHARALLEWLQAPGGRTGSILATELEKMHRELCHDLGWEPLGWIAVGRELRRLLGAKKELARQQNGRRLAVYRIPPAVSATASLRHAA